LGLLPLGQVDGGQEHRVVIKVVWPLRSRSRLRAADDYGENRALVGNAGVPSDVQVGAVVVAGTPSFWSLVRITAVDPDGQVHFVQLDRDDPAAQPLLATVA